MISMHVQCEILLYCAHSVCLQLINLILTLFGAALMSFKVLRLTRSNLSGAELV